MASSVSRDGADLVHLDEDGIGDALFDAPLQALGVGDEEIVADELDALAHHLGQISSSPSQSSSASPSSSETMGYWRVHSCVEARHLFAGLLALVGLLEDVLARLLVVELAGGGIERDGDVFARLVAGELDGLEDRLRWLRRST